MLLRYSQQRFKRIGIQKLHATYLCAAPPRLGVFGVELVKLGQQIFLGDLELSGAGDIVTEQEDNVRLEAQRLLNRGQRIGPPRRNDVLVDPAQRRHFRIGRSAEKARGRRHHQRLVALKEDKSEALLRRQSRQRSCQFLNDNLQRADHRAGRVDDIHDPPGVRAAQADERGGVLARVRGKLDQRRRPDRIGDHAQRIDVQLR